MKNKILWYEVDQIKTLIDSSFSKKEVLELMGYNKGDVRHHNRLTNFIEEYSIDINHFVYIPIKWVKLPEIIHECFTYADILRHLGLSTHGSNTTTAKKFIKYFNLNIDHFIFGAAGNKNIRVDSDVFCKNKITKSIVRKRFLKLVEYKCVRCGLNNWNNEYIVLEMDHIDGDRDNNELDNLRLLCPNCHSQTQTYGSKNTKRE